MRFGNVMSVKTAVVYWGTRGGGPRQMLNLIDSLEESNDRLYFYISSNNELLSEIQSRSKINLELNLLPSSIYELLLSFPTRNRLMKQMIADFEEKKITRVYFLLPHPWDLNLSKKIMKKGGIEIWRGIHDVRRHPGDIWPNFFTIKKLIRDSTTLVCFSSYIEEKLLKYGKPILQSDLFEVNREAKITSQKGSVLFVGRFRKYKGLELLAKTWPLVVNSRKSLTVGGQGKMPRELHKIGAKLIVKWLSDSEIEELVRNSHLVVLPYVEASQSGVIAIAHSLSTPVVITPVGGLVDQVIDGVNGLIAADTTPESLAATIDLALSMNWKLQDEANPLPNFLAKLQAD